MSTVNLSLEALQALAETILVAHNTSAANAAKVAAVLVAAEADGQQGHGASRIPSYAAHAKSGKVDGHARPASIVSAELALVSTAGLACPSTLPLLACAA